MFSNGKELLVEEDSDLFSASLLDRLPNQRHESGLLVRPLRSTDYDKGIVTRNTLT